MGGYVNVKFVATQANDSMMNRIALIALVSSVLASAARRGNGHHALPQGTHDACSNKILSGNYSYFVVDQAVADAPISLSFLRAHHSVWMEGAT